MTPLPLEKLEARRPDYLLLASTIALLVLGHADGLQRQLRRGAQRVQRRRLLPDAAAAVDRRRLRRACCSATRVDYRRWRDAVAADHVRVHRAAGPGAGARHRLEQLRRGALDQARPGRRSSPARSPSWRSSLYLADWLARRGPIVGELLQRAAAVRDHRRHRRGAGRSPARPGHDGDHRRRLGVRVLRRRAPTCCTSRCVALGGVAARRRRCWRT